jgi:hypothetical protein
LIDIAIGGKESVEEGTVKMINTMKAFKLDESAESLYRIKGELISTSHHPFY